MILFDTDFLIDLVNGQIGSANIATELDEIGEQPALSVISIHEYLLGVYLTYNGKDNLKDKLESANRDLSRFKAIPFTEDIANVSSKIQAEVTKKGKPIGINDIYIGATALYYNIKLVSRNKEHFVRISGLNLKTY